MSRAAPRCLPRGRHLRDPLALPCPVAGGGGLTSRTCAPHGGQLGRGAGDAPRQLIAVNRGRARKGRGWRCPSCPQRVPLPPRCPGPGAAPRRRWSWRRSGGQDSWRPISTKRFDTRYPGGNGTGGGPGAFVRLRPSEPLRGQRAEGACGAAPLGRRGLAELAFVGSELAVCSLRGRWGRLPAAVTADPSGRAVLPLLFGHGKGSRCARCRSWDVCVEPGLKAAESTVVLLEQNKPDQPKKKKQ